MRVRFGLSTGHTQLVDLVAFECHNATDGEAFRSWTATNSACDQGPRAQFDQPGLGPSDLHQHVRSGALAHRPRRRTSHVVERRVTRATAPRWGAARW